MSIMKTIFLVAATFFVSVYDAMGAERSIQLNHLRRLYSDAIVSVPKNSNFATLDSLGDRDLQTVVPGASMSSGMSSGEATPIPVASMSSGMSYGAGSIVPGASMSSGYGNSVDPEEEEECDEANEDCEEVEDQAAEVFSKLLEVFSIVLDAIISVFGGGGDSDSNE